jgi:hypothetical protein
LRKPRSCVPVSNVSKRYNQKPHLTRAPRWSTRLSMPFNWHKGWIVALMVETKLSADDPGLITEIGPRLRAQFGAPMLLLDKVQGPALIGSVRMRSANRRRLKSLPGQNSMAYSATIAIFARRYLDLAHFEGVAACRIPRLQSPQRRIPWLGNRRLIDVTSHNRAIRLHPRLCSRVSAGVVYCRSHHPESHFGYLTSELTDAAPGCPVYKITAGDVATVSKTTAPTRRIKS